MEEKRTRGILSIAVKYGIILGVLVFAVFVGGTRLSSRQNWVASVVDTVLVIVLMVLAHGQFKRTHAGMMRYAQGLGIGTALTSSAAVLRCLLTYLYLKFLNTHYLATVLQLQRAALAQRGITGQRAQQAMAITAILGTPAAIATTALIIGLIGGFIIALIVSIFTQKDDPRAVV